MDILMNDILAFLLFLLSEYIFSLLELAQPILLLLLELVFNSFLEWCPHGFFIFLFFDWLQGHSKVQFWLHLGRFLQLDSKRDYQIFFRRDLWFQVRCSLNFLTREETFLKTIIVLDAHKFYLNALMIEDYKQIKNAKSGNHCNQAPTIPFLHLNAYLICKKQEMITAYTNYYFIKKLQPVVEQALLSSTLALVKCHG